MQTFDLHQLHKILDAHVKWRRGETGGERADLRGVDLEGADLVGEYLPDQLVLLGESVRGRRRWAWLNADGSVAEIICGCNRFASVLDAEAHFISDDYDGESKDYADEMLASFSYWRNMIAARSDKLQRKEPDR